MYFVIERVVRNAVGSESYRPPLKPKRGGENMEISTTTTRPSKWCKCGNVLSAHWVCCPLCGTSSTNVKPTTEQVFWKMVHDGSYKIWGQSYPDPEKGENCAKSI